MIDPTFDNLVIAFFLLAALYQFLMFLANIYLDTCERRQAKRLEEAKQKEFERDMNDLREAERLWKEPEF